MFRILLQLIQTLIQIHHKVVIIHLMYHNLIIQVIQVRILIIVIRMIHQAKELTIQAIILLLLQIHQQVVIAV